MKKLLPIIALILLAWCWEKTSTNITTSSVSNSISSIFSSAIISNFSSNQNSSETNQISSQDNETKNITFLWKAKSTEQLFVWKETNFLVTPNSEWKVILQINLKHWENIETKISPATASNVVLRLSTITQPNWNTDWPFWNTYSYEVKKDWNYEFVFWVNMMASNEKYSWDYKISILVK